MKRGDALEFINIHCVAKYQKTRRGDSFETLKNFRKKFHTVPKKIERGDPLVSSGFVGYVKKVKNERGTLCTKFPLAWLGLSSFISFCKKYIRDELCGLTKKKEKKLATVIVGLFSLKEKAPTKNTGKSRFFKNSFLKNHEADFFFRRKCSLGSCATFSENMVSVSVMGFEKFASQFWKFGTCHEICEKNVTI